MPITSRDIPEWLASLRGDSPLLSTSEWEFLAELRSLIIKNTETRSEFSGDAELREKLSVMRNNFNRVVEYLNNSQTKEYFIKTYPKWKITRDITILQLEEIADSVNKDHQNCRISRDVASSVSLLGGVVCLATKAHPTLRMLGSAMMGLGALTSAGTSVVNVGLLHENVKKAKQAIEEDREFSERIWKWISDGSFVEEAMNNIRYIDVDFNLKKAANAFQNLFKKRHTHSGVIEKYITMLLKSFNCSTELLTDISDVVGILTATSMLYDRYGAVFNLVFDTFKFLYVLPVVSDVIRSTAKISLSVNACKCTELTSCQKKGIGVVMALEALNIFLNSKDRNSMSKEAQKITQAAEKLEEEAKVFQQIYHEIIDA